MPGNRNHGALDHFIIKKVMLYWFSKVYDTSISNSRAKVCNSMLFTKFPKGLSIAWIYFDQKEAVYKRFKKFRKMPNHVGW